jgi:hypothetical protein
MDLLKFNDGAVDVIIPMAQVARMQRWHIGDNERFGIETVEGKSYELTGEEPAVVHTVHPTGWEVWKFNVYDDDGKGLISWDRNPLTSYMASIGLFTGKVEQYDPGRCGFEWGAVPDTRSNRMIVDTVRGLGCEPGEGYWEGDIKTLCENMVRQCLEHSKLPEPTDPLELLPEWLREKMREQ